MEAGVLKGVGGLDDGLSHVLNLLLTCDGDLHGIRLVGQLDRHLEQSSGVLVMLVVMGMVVVMIMGVGVTIGTVG